jgi:hypothetical protein
MLDLHLHARASLYCICAILITRPFGGTTVLYGRGDEALER